jgi:conjugative relaxase-like TrwC/TraI family protein
MVILGMCHWGYVSKLSDVNHFSTIGVIRWTMLRITVCNSADHAKGYFTTADYYTEDLEVVGAWGGKAALRLGLRGAIDQQKWDALCDNLDPNTGKPLTVRYKEERRIGYDFTFNVPKSFTLLHAFTQDNRLLEAFTASVNETMLEIEREMKTRVRRGGISDDRVTANMVWGSFVHHTSRPVDGIPDPHMHAHIFAQNCTFDEAEQRWKAGQFGDIKRDGPYFEAKFHSRLARRVQELGVPVERTKDAWEISGFSRSTLEKFSRRTAQIEEMAVELGITSAAQKAELGAKTREKKQKNLSMRQLREHWRSRLSSDEQTAIGKAAMQIGSSPIPEHARHLEATTQLAIDHSFERKSVVPERELLTAAIKWSLGVASAQAAEQAVHNQNLIRGDHDGRRLVTTRQVFAEEQRMSAGNWMSTATAVICIREPMPATRRLFRRIASSSCGCIHRTGGRSFTRRMPEIFPARRRSKRFSHGIGSSSLLR